MNNRGLDLEKLKVELDGSEYLFGAAPVCVFGIPEVERRSYLPIGELQRGAEDFMDCVTRASINILESKFNFAYRRGLLFPENKKFLEDNGYVVSKGGLPYIEFSDRWIAVKSGTTKQGNSLKAPVHACHEWGMVPKKWLPKVENMTWDEYHDKSKLTPSMEAIGKEFLKRFPISYWQVKNTEFGKAASTGSLNVAGHAWNFPKNGVYESDSDNFNHAFKVFEFTDYFFVFDNYLDQDNDWIKKLSPIFKFWDWGYHLAITAQNRVIEGESEAQSLQKLINHLIELIKQYFLKTEPQPIPNPIPPVPATEKLYEAAFKAIGTDPSKNGMAPRERACAESLSFVIRKVYPQFPIFLSTSVLNVAMQNSPLFKRIPAPEPGCVSIFPTVGLKIGHCGVWGRRGWVMSNDSKDGLWKANYSDILWVHEAAKRGLALFHYLPL